METLGWIGGILLAWCGAPEALKAYRTKRTELTWTFLLMWWLGELLVLIPVLQLGEGYLILNYSLNLIFTSVILYYKVRNFYEQKS